MKGLNRQEGDLFVDQVSLADIAEKYGTPAYVYSASKIRENLNNYIDVVGENDKICYSVKSNSNINKLDPELLKYPEAHTGEDIKLFLPRTERRHFLRPARRQTRTKLPQHL